MPKPCPPIMYALLGGLIAGCATNVPAPGIADFDFRVRGKIAVRGVESPFAATFDWRQTGGRFEIYLWGALGQGRVRLGGDEREFAIRDSRGRTTRGLDAERLMQRELGWAAPVQALRYWIQGKPHPGEPVRAEASQRPATFEQFGWTVAIAGRHDRERRSPPSRLVVSRGDVRIIIVCKEWSFAE